MRLKDKVAIVTGGGSGIGQATARLFAQHGARVVIADVNIDGAQATADTIRQAGGEATALQVDITDSTQIREMVDTAIETYGGIDILFNGAGLITLGNALDTDEQSWHRVIAVNLTGTFLCSRAVLPHLVERGGGSIINVSSSTGAHDAIGNAVSYVASKGGVTMLTKAMAVDHAREKVRVNALAPGPTDTPMLRQFFTPEALKSFQASFPIGRLAQPDEIAAAALFLASDEASFVTGAILAVDGGQTAEV